ncbi:MAG: hypothetical protein MUD06_10260 [Rhodospirillales bacterium]|nr:hypothetical protein [Rhodospirillales bacterium]
MRNKVVTADEAIAIIRDGDTLANTGFVGDGAPEELRATSPSSSPPARATARSAG